MTNGSGDYAIAFSTHPEVRRTAPRRESAGTVAELPNELMSPLFQAAVEAIEEAVINSLFAAEAMEGNGRRIEALPVDEVLRLYRRERAGASRD